jgi:hypothetical protein
VEIQKKLISFNQALSDIPLSRLSESPQVRKRIECLIKKKNKKKTQENASGSPHSTGSTSIHCVTNIPLFMPPYTS